MPRAIEQRLRKLEVAKDGSGRIHLVFSMTSDEAEWVRQFAEMIRSGQARPGDEFMRIGWMPETSPGLVKHQNAPC